MREIIEFELIEQYHWLPHDIEKIPYKKLQKIFIIEKQKNATKNMQASVKQINRQNQQTNGRGQRKRSYREV